MAGPDDAPENPFEILATGANPQAALDHDSAVNLQQGLSSNAKIISHSDTDAPYITDLEQWNGKSHQDIYQGAQAMQPGILKTQAKVWSDIAGNLGGDIFGLTLSVQNALAEGFHGQTANAASDGAQKFFKQATDVQAVMVDVATRLNSVGDAAEAVKLSVPPPTAQSPSSPVQVGTQSYYQSLGVTSPAAATSAGRSEEDLYRDAIAAMHNNYDPTYRPAGVGVPTFIAVDQPGNGVSNGPVNTGPTATGPGISNSNSGPGAHNDKPTSRQPNNSQQTNPSSLDSSSQSPGPSSQGASPQSTIPSSVSPTSTNAAGYNGGGLGSGGGMGGGGGAGFGGFGGGGDGNAGTNSGPGRSIPGAGFTNSERAAAAAANAGRAGTAGMNGMPGMGGAGARKSESTDSEHTTPDYLVMDREEELIGHLDPMAPGAIGANFPAAQTRRVEGEGNGR
jgi:hypothetical protein